MVKNEIELRSTTFRPADSTDERSLGIVVFDVAWWSLTTQTWLPLLQWLAIGLALSLLTLVLVGARLPWAARLLALLLVAIILLAMRHSDMRFVYRLNALNMTLALAVLLALASAIIWRWRPAATPLPVKAWAQQHWPALIGYLVLTAVMLHPLLWQFTTHILGSPGDSFKYVWRMFWFEHALVDLQVSPAFAPHLFYPSGFELARSELTPANTILGLPITWLAGPIVSYNVVMLASFVLTGCTTYLLAHRLGASRPAAWVGGILFAFCLRRYFHASGHLPLMGTQWLALALYGWEGVITRRRTWDGYVSGLGMALTIWTSWYYAPTFVLLMAFYTLVRPGLRQRARLMQSWPAVLLAGSLTTALVLPLLQPYLELSETGADYRHRLLDLLIHSPEPIEFLLPNPFHPLWRDWMLPLFNWKGEHFVALGYSLIVLMLIGLWVGRKRPAVLALGLIIAINLVMALGPRLRLDDGTIIALPAWFVYDHVPVLDGIRVWNRMVIYVVLCGAVLAALALSALPRRFARVGLVLATLLILFEYAATLPMVAPASRLADVWLSEQPGNGAVIEMPNKYGAPNELYTMYTGKPASLVYTTFTPELYYVVVLCARSVPASRIDCPLSALAHPLHSCQ
ncbi:MAG: hypothetical protein HC837_09725 [Chloroflexaceae bacterium]|nr:hypothetical protein [Chloroflexaceae bacterium]